jgi:hypothetical protein
MLGVDLTAISWLWQEEEEAYDLLYYKANLKLSAFWPLWYRYWSKP